MAYVTLKTFDSAIHAHVLKNRLESEGVDCLLFDENIVTLNPLLNFAVGGIRLQVFQEDFNKAKSILLEIENTPSTDNQDQVIKCPNCNSTKLFNDFKTVKNPKGIIAIIVALLFSVFPIYSKSVYKCKECNMEFEPKST